jgi:hypothetical protein
VLERVRAVPLRVVIALLCAAAILAVTLSRELGSTSTGGPAGSGPAGGPDPTSLLSAIAHPPTSGTPSGSPTAPSPSSSRTAAAPTRSPSVAAPVGTGHAASPAATARSGASGSATPTAPTQAQLQAALLQASQLPDGLTAQPATGTGVANVTECPVLLQMQDSASAVASADFQGGSTGPFVSEILVQYSVPTAEHVMAEFAEVPALCPGFSTTLGDFPIQITISTQTFPSYGDQTAALGVHLAFVGTPISVDAQLVAIRHGGTVISLMIISLPPDPALPRLAASAAYADVASRW